MSISLQTTAQAVNRKINPSRIDDFKAMVSARGGFSRSNRFLVVMQPPTQTLFGFDVQDLLVKSLSRGIGSIGIKDFITDPRDLAMLCDSAQLPGRQIQTLDYSSWRQTTKVPTAYFNEDVTLTFLLTNDYYAKKLFDRWTNMVIDRKSYHLSYDKTYKCDVLIHQLDENNIPVYSVKLRGAFPTGVNSVAFDNSAEDIVKLSVTFTYEDFEEPGPVKGIVQSVTNVVGGLLRRLV